MPPIPADHAALSRAEHTILGLLALAVGALVVATLIFPPLAIAALFLLPALWAWMAQQGWHATTRALVRRRAACVQPDWDGAAQAIGAWGFASGLLRPDLPTVLYLWIAPTPGMPTLQVSAYQAGRVWDNPFAPHAHLTLPPRIYATAVRRLTHQRGLLALAPLGAPEGVVFAAPIEPTASHHARLAAAAGAQGPDSTAPRPTWAQRCARRWWGEGMRATAAFHTAQHEAYMDMHRLSAAYTGLHRTAPPPRRVFPILR